MSSLANALRAQIDYSAWASKRLVVAASQLSPDGLTQNFRTADGSILGTLVHIYAADRMWHGRIQQTPPSVFASESDYSLTVLETDWPRLHAAWQQWAASLNDEAALAPFPHTDLKGRPWVLPMWKAVMHVVNHATHHRGQVAGFMRALGHTPPNTDFAAYCRHLE
jgi:uncharacterized damage-inducible protein DinB